MGCCCLQLILFAIPVYLGYRIYKFLYKKHKLPNLNYDEYWGEGLQDSVPDDTVYPYKIVFAPQKIDELKRKLSDDYEFTPTLEGAPPLEYGINVDYLKKTIQYWRDDYLPRWQEREKFFNQLPHFQTRIQGLNIHFIHAKPSAEVAEGKTVIPILLIHGWPGSVREFYQFIPKLLENSGDPNVVFEVIAPSLPGYGWSDGARKVGFNSAKVAIVLRNLMIRLGHSKFIIQGGDWGSIIGSQISTIFPENVIAYHSNMCQVYSPLGFVKLLIASLYPSLFIDKQYQALVFPVAEKYKFLLREAGYFALQATKPDTIGNALANHPVGLAAYILEKFSSFIGNIEPDALLDNLMVYYLNNKFTTSCRLYAESFAKSTSHTKVARVSTTVPTAACRFLVDLPSCLDWQLKDKYLNLVQSTYHMEGGHFAALEVPEILYTDFVQFIKTLRRKEILP